jgi:hypothetical protein
MAARSARRPAARLAAVAPEMNNQTMPTSASGNESMWNPWQSIAQPFTSHVPVLLMSK